MSLSNLLEYSDNYFMTSASLRDYYRDEVSDNADENSFVNNYRINNNKTTTSKSLNIRQN